MTSINRHLNVGGFWSNLKGLCQEIKMCCEFETLIPKWGEGSISSLLKICIFLFLCSRFQDMECESNTWRLGISSYVTLWDKILEKIQQVIYGQKSWKWRNHKFPHAFGGECKADFEATLVQAKMHRAQALINQTKQFKVLEKLWNLMIS